MDRYLRNKINKNITKYWQIIRVGEMKKVFEELMEITSRLRNSINCDYSTVSYRWVLGRCNFPLYHYEYDNTFLIDYISVEYTNILTCAMRYERIQSNPTLIKYFEEMITSYKNNKDVFN